MLHISQEDFEKLTTFIKKNYGLDLSEKKVLIESRLSNYIMDSGYCSFEEYLPTLYNDYMGNEIANLINRLTTNYTYFMREHKHYEHFVNVFLPYAEKNIRNHDICIWSAGCSFGNEPYNLAICLEEYFGFRHKIWDSKILATDISFNALRMAKRGVFTEKAVSELPELWKMKYFDRQPNSTYQVKDEIRNNVVFKYHNLMEEINFKKKFDLIVCRNVMIYFDEDTKRNLIKRFFEVTDEGGYLYIGHAESMPKDTGYEYVKPAIFRKPVKGDE